MATTIESLFGVTPEALQAQREANLQAQALRFAQLNPSQRIQMGAFMAGNRLAEGIGGLLGAKDPELERIQQRQEMLKGVDPNSPSSLREKAADALARNDFSAASLLTQRAAEVEKAQAELASTQALTAQRLRERAAADPFQQFLRAAVGKVTPESLEKYQQSGKPSDLDWIEKPNQTEIQRLQAYRDTLPAGSQARREVDAVIKAAGEGKGTKITVAPEIKQAPDIVGAINAADKALEPEINMINSSRLAKELINQTANSNNSQTWEAARTTVAKAVGENKLSNEDIRRTGVDPRLVQGALDWVNKKIEGVPSQDIQKQLFVLASVLERNAATRYDAKTNRMREAGRAANFPGNPSTYFPTAAERGLTTPAPAAAGNVVDWNSLKK